MMAEIATPAISGDVIPATAGAWAERISVRLQDSARAILDVGAMLIEAKDALEHGEWGAMCELLPFGERTAQMLMRASTNPVLSNPKHVSVLPPSWGTLYQLSRVPDEVLERAISEGAVTPDMQRKQVKQLMPVQRARASQHDYEVGRDYCTIDDLAGLSDIQTVYADPPWLYGNQRTRGATGDHYSGMTVDEICELPVPDIIADVAHLHLWTTNAFLFEAQRVIEAWGFEYKSCYVWVKPQIGMGNYWRVSHEFLLFGTRGSLTFPEKNLRSWGEFKRRKHSGKPEEIRGMIERVSPAPRLEMFARRPAPGWICWGNEIESNLFHQVAANAA